MEIKKIKEMLPDYVQGLLSIEDSDAIKEHIKKSEPLRKEYEKLRSYFDAIDTLKPVKAPRNFLDNVHERIATQSSLTKIVKTLFQPLHIKIPLELAGVILTTVLVVLIFNPFKPETIPPVELNEPTIKKDTPPVESKTVEEQADEMVAEIKDKDVKKEAPIEKTLAKVKKTEDITVIPKKVIISKKSAKKADLSTKPSLEKNEVQYAAKSTPPFGGTQGAGSEPAKPKTQDELTAELEEKIASPRRQNELGVKPEKKLIRREKAKAIPSDVVPVKEQAEEEVYAERIIERKDSIIIQKRKIKSEVIDIGRLALVITRKAKSKAVLQKQKSKKQESLRAKSPEPNEKSAAVTTGTAPAEADDNIQPESENELIFSQVQSTIKANKGKYTLLQDKLQKLDKRYYVIEVSPGNYPALRKALEKQGVVLDESLSFVEKESELIRFNLVVRIE